jgi:uncharacterized protein (TIGR02231 family)
MTFEKDKFFEAGSHRFKLLMPASGNFRFLRVLGPGAEVRNLTEKQHVEVASGNLQAQINLSRESLSALQEEVSWLKLEIDVLIGQRQILKDNSRLSGQETAFSVEEIRAFTDFYGERQLEIRKQERQKNKEIQEKRDSIHRLNEKIKELEKSKRGKSYSALIVDLEVKQAGEYQLLASYSFYRQAGWKPAYALRFKGQENPLNIKMEAVVWNQTGLDWENVPLSFSNTWPDDEQSPPALKPLLAEIPRLYAIDTVVTFDPETYEEPLQVVRNETSLLDYLEQVELPNAFLYRINQAPVVPDKTREQRILIKELELSASYQYSSYPAQGTGVYLLAKVPNVSQYRFMPGKIRLFTEGQYIGETSIEDQVSGDELEISLGKVPGILSSREVRNYAKSAFLSGSRKDSYEVVVNLKNNKSTTVEVIVTDQYPISTDSRIEVKLVDDGKAEIDEKNGFLNWDISLLPGKNRELKFVYEIKYPEKETVIVRKSKY